MRQYNFRSASLFQSLQPVWLGLVERVLIWDGPPTFPRKFVAGNASRRLLSEGPLHTDSIVSAITWPFSRRVSRREPETLLRGLQLGSCVPGGGEFLHGRALSSGHNGTHPSLKTIARHCCSASFVTTPTTPPSPRPGILSASSCLGSASMYAFGGFLDNWTCPFCLQNLPAGLSREGSTRLRDLASVGLIFFSQELQFNPAPGQETGNLTTRNFLPSSTVPQVYQAGGR